MWWYILSIFRAITKSLDITELKRIHQKGSLTLPSFKIRIFKYLDCVLSNRMMIIKYHHFRRLVNKSESAKILFQWWKMLNHLNEAIRKTNPEVCRNIQCNNVDRWIDNVEEKLECGYIVSHHVIWNIL